MKRILVVGALVSLVSFSCGLFDSGWDKFLEESFYSPVPAMDWISDSYTFLVDDLVNISVSLCPLEANEASLVSAFLFLDEPNFLKWQDLEFPVSKLCQENDFVSADFEVTIPTDGDYYLVFVNNTWDHLVVDWKITGRRRVE